MKPVTLPETPHTHTHTTRVEATAISQFETQLIVLPLFFCFFTHESTGSCWASQTDLKYAFLMPVTLESWDCRLGLLDLTLLRLIFNCYHRFRKEISLLRSNSAQFANKKKIESWSVSCEFFVGMQYWVGSTAHHGDLPSREHTQGLCK